MFISAIFSMFLFALPVPDASPRQYRNDVCPGAVYFIKHGHHAAWQQHRKLLCRVGGHDFYGEVVK